MENKHITQAILASTYCLNEVSFNCNQCQSDEIMSRKNHKPVTFNKRKNKRNNKTGYYR